MPATIIALSTDPAHRFSKQPRKSLRLVAGLGAEAVIEITGLRNPCHQLNGIAPGLMDAVLDRAPDDSLIRKCGVMAVVVTGGVVHASDRLEIASLPLHHLVLCPV